MKSTQEIPPVVEMRNIKKNFGAVQALRGVDLVLRHNEVLGLIGDNGAGESTLMKVLSGAYIPDEGEIFIEGQKAHISNPMDARRQGIEMVYQDYALANNLDISANVFLGREAVRVKLGPISVLEYRQMEQDTKSLINRLKIDIPSVRQKVERLSGGQRQAVAIARATAFDAKVIIMDEPTAALSVAAIDKVLDLIRELKAHWQVSCSHPGFGPRRQPPGLSSSLTRLQRPSSAAFLQRGEWERSWGRSSARW
jgi:ABC-type sugar transport system ATPase subunit